MARNVAGRLLEICEKLRTTHGGVAGHEAWAAVLGVELPDGVKDPRQDPRVFAEVVRRWSTVVMLGTDVEDAMQQQGFEAGVFTNHVTQFCAGVAQQPLAAQIKQVQDLLGAEVVAQLNACENLLAHTEAEIPGEEREALREDLWSLLQEVLATPESELPVELKSYLVLHLEAMLVALSSYEVDGAGPLRDALRDLVTDLVEEQDLVRDDSLRKWFQRILGIFLKGPAVVVAAGAWLGVLGRLDELAPFLDLVGEAVRQLPPVPKALLPGTDSQSTSAKREDAT